MHRRSRYILFIVFGLVFSLLGLTINSARQYWRDTALLGAIKRNDVAACQTLLDQGANPNVRDLPRLKPSLWQIVRGRLTGHFTYVQEPAGSIAPYPTGRPVLLLLMENIDDSRAIFPGRSLYTSHGQAMIRALIEHGADVNATYSRFPTQSPDPAGFPADFPPCPPPLFAAATMPECEWVCLLLKHGANPNVICGSFTPLTWAAHEGKAKVVRALLDAGVDVNQSGPGGYTALMGAAAAGHDDIVALLLQRHADVIGVDHTGRDALDYAILLRDDSEPARTHYNKIIKLLKRARPSL